MTYFEYLVKVSFVYITPQLSHMQPQRRCSHTQTEPAHSLRRSRSPRSQTLAYSHAATRSLRFLIASLKRYPCARRAATCDDNAMMMMTLRIIARLCRLLMELYRRLIPAPMRRRRSNADPVARKSCLGSDDVTVVASLFTRALPGRRERLKARGDRPPIAVLSGP